MDVDLKGSCDNASEMAMAFLNEVMCQFDEVSWYRSSR